MYRLLIFVVLLSIVESKPRCIGPECRTKRHRERGHHPEDMFRKVAHQLIGMDRKLENFCRDNMNMRVREVYGTDSYTLKYTIPEFQPQDFVVKVMHRAIIVSAERWDPIGLKSFHDVKMLPDNLDSEEGSWSLQDGTFTVTFPYRTPIGTEIKRSCGSNNITSYAIITVPMAAKEKGKKEPVNREQEQKESRNKEQANWEQDNKTQEKLNGPELFTEVQES